ncbi:hypothetical protein HMPREF9524_03079, partial [Enterococcus faecium TX0133a01]
FVFYRKEQEPRRGDGGKGVKNEKSVRVCSLARTLFVGMLI